ncbi:PhoH family protein [Intestinibacillus sp. Marseille-P6563]|uniref:PhoH family protein n=1 Tax=Intestinibacillus sp. Marseille-P6563 TaxID=2364792 RepID=UPI001FAA8682|nr:PhoH family protein [Intestinibacillus sp. Marseille-P6563]
MHSEKVSLDVSVMQDLFGVGDTNIAAIETALSVSVSTRGGFVEVSGEEANVRLALDTLRTLEKMHKNGETLNDFAVSRAIELVREGQGDAMVAAMQDTIAIAHNGAPIKCRTIGQRKYVDAIRKNTVTICIGPAGTGKTYLAVAAVVGMLKRKEIERIVMCRPAVEAGEKLGFLPGDLQNKVDPYLRPLYDALDELLGHDTVQRYIENRTIEIAPLAYMRGRTLKNAGCLIDECQNMTLMSHKLILTRLGEGSRMILTGDITQIDLPDGTESGLAKCAELLSDIEGIGVVRLNSRDVIRHKLVGQIVKAFDKYEGQKKDKKPLKADKYRFRKMTGR